MNYRIHWSTPDGQGAGFRTVSTESIQSALSYGESLVEPAIPLPESPVEPEYFSHLHNAAVYDWEKECVRIRLRNDSRKARVSRIQEEDFFPPTVAA